MHITGTKHAYNWYRAARIHLVQSSMQTIGAEQHGSTTQESQQTDPSAMPNKHTELSPSALPPYRRCSGKVGDRTNLLHTHGVKTSTGTFGGGWTTRTNGFLPPKASGKPEWYLSRVDRSATHEHAERCPRTPLYQDGPRVANALKHPTPVQNTPLYFTSVFLN